MDENARDRLEKMTDYERWSLERLADLSGNQSIEVKTIEKLLEGESDNVIQPNGGIHANRTSTSSIGAKQGKKAVKSVWPLIFASGYKGIDFIVEWLLEENGEKKKGDELTFGEKMRKINGLYDKPQFELPAHLSEYPEVCERVFRLYYKLSSCRHNVVHGNEFT